MIPHAPNIDCLADRVLAAAIALVGVLAITTGLVKPSGAESAIGLLLLLCAFRVGWNAR